MTSSRKGKVVSAHVDAPPAGDVLTRTEAARVSRINIQNIDEAIRREELRAFRPIGRKVLILRADLMEWILGAPVWKGAQR